MCSFYVCITDVLRAFKILKCIEEPIFQFTKMANFLLVIQNMLKTSIICLFVIIINIIVYLRQR